MEFHRSRAFCGRAPISSTDVFTYDLTLGMASASCEPQRETGTHRAADRPAKRREEQFIPLEMKSGHGFASSSRITGYAEVILILDLPFSGLSNLRPTPASWTRSTDLPAGSGRFFPKMGYGAPLQGQTS